jgi:glycosyltransferase involved in cell wall biosynthesis
MSASLLSPATSGRRRPGAGASPLSASSVLVSVFTTGGNAGGSLATLEIASRLGAADLTMLVADSTADPANFTHHHSAGAGRPHFVVNRLRPRPHIRPGTAKTAGVLRRGVTLPADLAWVRRQDHIAAASGADLVCSMTTLMHAADVFFVHFLRCEAVEQTYGVPVTRADALLRRVDPKERQLLRLERTNVQARNHRLLIAPSHRTAAALTYHYGVDPARIRAVHNGVDHERFRPPGRAGRARARRALALETDDVFCLFVGRSPERKGLPALLQAAAQVRRDAPNGTRLRLAVAGFPDGQAARDTVSDLGVPAYVPGEIDQDELVRHWYAAADLLVLPAMVEPFGLVALEAMACGVPAVVSDAAGVAEVIQPGRTGIVLSNPSLDADLSAVLTAAVDGRLDLAGLGRAARADVVDRLSWDARAAALAAELAQLQREGPSLLSRAGHRRIRHLPYARATSSR